MGQRTQRDEKKGGGREWLKKSFRCRCDPAAEYFNITAIRGGQAPFGHPPCMTCDGAFLRAMQSRNYPSFSANAPCPAGPADATEEKDSRILRRRLFFSSLSPRCWEPEMLYNVRHNLPCQTPGSLGVLWFWSLVLTLRLTSAQSVPGRLHGAEQPPGHHKLPQPEAVPDHAPKNATIALLAGCSCFFCSQTPPHVLYPVHNAPATCTRDGACFGPTIALTRACSYVHEIKSSTTKNHSAIYIPTINFT